MTDGPAAVNRLVRQMARGQDAAMTPVVRSLSAFFLLAACGPMTIYHRPGVPVSRMQSDSTKCEVRALKDAPVANQIRQYPPIYHPGGQVCDGAGNCRVWPGYWTDGGFYTVDVNRDLRARVMDLCMAERGYRPVSLPTCPASVRAAVPPGQTKILPEITETSCVIRHDDGSWQIVTPIKATDSKKG